MFGTGMMTAVLTIRPDTKQLRRDLEKDVPAAVKKGTREAAREAERGFKKVGKDGGEALTTELEKATAAGLNLDKNGKWRNARGQYASAGVLLGAGLTDGLDKSVNKGFDKTMSNMSSRFSNFGKKAMMGGAVATAAVWAPAAMIGKAAADSAIMYEDAIAANEQLFGTAGLAVLQKWSDTRADAFNMATRDVQTYSQGFAGHMQAFGDEQTAAAETTKLLERLADSRSFYGGRMEDKILAVQSMLRGEFDPMETAFPGASIKQSDVVERAAQMGLLTVNTAQLNKETAVVAERQAKVNELHAAGKTGTVEHQKAVADLALAQQKLEETSQGAAKSMTKEARVQASLALLYEQTDKAAGDIARTQDSTANQIEAARMEWENLKLTLGQQLLPIIGELAPKFGAMMERMADNGTFDKLIPLIERLAAAGVKVVELLFVLPGPVQTALAGMVLFGGPVTALVGGLSSLLGLLMRGPAAFGAFGAAASAAGTGGLGKFAAAGAGLGTTGAVGAAALAGGYAAGSAINSNVSRLWGSDQRLSDNIGNRIADWMGYDDGGVHPGSRGVHTPAWVAGGETILPTHKYPVGEAMRRVGITGPSDTAHLEALVAQAMSRPASVTVVAPPGMNPQQLATEIDRVRRGAESKRLRPAANRRPR